MRENNRKSRTSLPQHIEIPPLNIPQIRLDDPQIKYKPAKAPLDFLRAKPIDHNQQFLKEKTLYRYEVSRKLSRTSNNKSLTCFVPNQCLQPNRSQNSIEINTSHIKNDKERSVCSQSSNGGPKVKHFKRKNKNDLNQDSFQSITKETFEPAIKQENHNSRQRIYSQKENNNSIEKEPTSLRVENNQLKRQIVLLKEQKTKQNNQNIKKDKLINTLRQDLSHLQKQLSKINPIHSDNFITQNRLQNELIARGHTINELKQKIKYLELQNNILKKTKKQKEEQTSVISRLEMRNKALENRVRVMSALRTKRNRLKSSMMSSCSEISLNLSADADDDDFEKFYDALMTTERTQEKYDAAEMNSTIQERSDDEEFLQLPLWPPQLER